MKKLSKIGFRLIDFLWVLLFGLTVVFALLSPNLKLGDNDFFGTSTTMVTTGLILFLVGLTLSLMIFTNWRQKLAKVFITHKYVTATIFLLVVVVLQILFLYFVHPESGFDSGMLRYAATSKKHVLETNVSSYFSLNQNNLPIMLLMRQLVELTGQTSWQFFDYVTLFLVDLSVILNILTVRIIAPKAVAMSMYLQGIWLLVFPSILMPYTDTWVMPLVSGFLLTYFLLQAPKINLKWKVVAGLFFGPLVVGTYFIKPSAIIPVIAIVLVSLLFIMAKKPTLKQTAYTLGILLVVIVPAFVSYQGITQKIAQQDYIQINPDRKIPMIHFASMGIVDEGGYSEEQAIQMAVLPTKAEKSAYSKDIILQRLKELKVSGYLTFLLEKHNRNTADGTFGWLKEGNFFIENQKPNQKGIPNKLKNFIFLYGENIADFRFAAQLVWLACLLLILLGWGNKTQETFVLRLSLIGGFLFLLLFEGGRSRYMIQFLPCFILLAALSFGQVKIHLQQISQWWQFGKIDKIED